MDSSSKTQHSFVGVNAKTSLVFSLPKGEHQNLLITTGQFFGSSKQKAMKSFTKVVHVSSNETQAE